jgi:hypothetical protein
MVKARVSPIGLLMLGAVYAAHGREADADRDGLSDQFEQALLQKFAPRFHISASDCDIAPAEFHSDLPQPRVKARNGTIYGQVFPLPRGSGAGGFVEIHFYHLWAQDCGLTRHALDVESVSALLQTETNQSLPESWRAAFWHSAAHEGTLCDMGNGATSAALGAIDQGPDVWVSRNKHASFLSRDLCSKGCGGDVCDGAGVMGISKLINIGEPGAPMNGAIWSASASWPLASKMTTRYTSTLIARMPTGTQVELVPARDVMRGTRSTIKVAGRTYGSLLSADARTEAAAAAGTTGVCTGLDVAGTSVASSAKHTGRSLRAASSAARRSFKRAFRTQRAGSGR